jgi:hypothetical protein
MLFSYSCNTILNNKTPKTTSTSYYKHFEGTVNNQPVSLDLTFTKNYISGSYYKDATEELFDVNGEFLTNDSLILIENLIFWNNKNRNDLNNYFKGILKGDSYRGIFITPDTSFPYELKETYNHQSIPLSYISKSDSVLHPTSKKKIVQLEFESVFTSENKYEFIHPYIYQLLGDTSYRGSMNDYITKKLSYDIHTLDTTELNQMQAHPFYYSDYCDVAYNKNNHLILTNTKMAFLGGVHENFNVQYCSIDLKTQQLVTIQQVLNDNEIKKLPSLLEQKFRKQYALEDKDSLSKILYYNDNHFLNNTYFITNKGIGFLYNTHEIGSFTLGLITLYLSFDEIKKK